MKKNHLVIGWIILMAMATLWYAPTPRVSPVTSGYLKVGWLGSITLDPGQVIVVQNTDIRPLCFVGQSMDVVYPGEKIALENLRSTKRRVVPVEPGFPFLPICLQPSP